MPQNTNSPFFLLGCAWSGIPVIKKILLRHPHLYSFETTNFYRWSEPFGTKAFERSYQNAALLKANWLRDGFSHENIKDMFGKAENRQNISNQYARRFARRKKLKATRWFDATPQNVYGLLLLKAHFSDSKIIHVYGHPIEVISSLLFSPSRSPVTLVAAVNHWLETMQIISMYKRMNRDDLIEVKYEDFLSEPEQTIRNLLSELEEDVDAFDFSKLRKSTKAKEMPSKILLDRRKRSGYASMLSNENVAYILKHCKDFMKAYRYEIPSPSDTQAQYSERDVSIHQPFIQNPGEQNN